MKKSILNSKKIDIKKFIVPNIFFLLFLLAVTMGFFFSINIFFSTILISFLLFHYSNPFYKYLLGKNWHPSLSATIVTLSVFFFILLPIVVVVTFFSYELTNRYDSILSSVKKVISFVNETDWNNLPLIKRMNIDLKDIQQNLAQGLNSTIQLVLNSIKNVFVNLISSFVQLLLILYIVFYLLLDGEKFLILVKKILPLNDKEEDKIYHEAVKITDAVIIGMIVIGCLEGIWGGIILYFLGIQSAVIWSLLMMVLSMLPLVGTNSVLIPFAVYFLSVGNYLGMGIVIVLGIGGIMISQNFIKPKVIGDKSGLHPVLVVLSTVGGLSCFGIMGIFYGPILATLFIVFWRRFYIRFKNLY